MNKRRPRNSFMSQVEIATREAILRLNSEQKAKLRENASRELDNLREQSENAKIFLSKVLDRVQDSPYPQLSAYAESAGPIIIIRLCEFLDKLLTKASESEDAFTYTRIFACCKCLLGHIEDGMFTEQKFPSDKAVSELLCDGILRSARTAYTDVLDMLLNCHLEYGIRYPGFPIISL